MKPKDDVTHWKQNVFMETPYINEHCQYVQNVSQRCKVKVVKFH